MEDVRAAGAHIITTSGIFLKQDKKIEGQIDRIKMSGERRRPSREEGNFPKVHRVYVGLAGPSAEERMLGKSVVAEQSFSSSDLLTGCPFCYLSISLLSQCLPLFASSSPSVLTP